MMKNRTRLLLLMGVLMLSLTMVAACSDDDDDNPTTPQTQDPPSFPLSAASQMELPAGLTGSGDAQASVVMGYAALANSFSGYLNFFAPPTSKAAADGPPWVYSWSVQDSEVNMTFTLTIDETADSYTWEYKVNGTDGETTYTDAVFYWAEAAMDGSSGNIRIFDIDFSTTDPVLAWNWSESALGAFAMELVSYDDVDPTRVVFGIDPDGSGDLNVYEMFEQNWRTLEYYEWTALGAGSYILYDYDGGDDITGSWEAGFPM